MKSHQISLHKDKLDENGMDLQPISEAGYVGNVPHRDDHYMFVIQETGNFLFEVDFKGIALTGPSVCFIAPGQIHRYINFENSKGWLVFADPRLIPNEYREIFDLCLNTFQSFVININSPIYKMLSVLNQISGQELLPLVKPLNEGLIAMLSGFIASRILLSQTSAKYSGGQKHNIVIRFKRLVYEKHRELKQVKSYASLIFITALYLNETVKEITGFPASYWINQEILLEAKRLLYYTTRDVKQIAYELGYEDHAYFSRFFKRHMDMTPLEFRNTKHLVNGKR